ncbi:MAG: PIG-L family deacetylase [Anaerolineales bacterium]|jgi:LmbE family N-acetylglucosaminyl deacetylase
MKWVYLSPHLDDVALSCGGLVWEQSQVGYQVTVLTICAGDPPDVPLSTFAKSLHDRWQTGVEAIVERRREDLVSCQEMRATAIHLSIPDCIYRRSEYEGKPICDSEESLTEPSHHDEGDLIWRLGKELRQLIPPDGEVVCPLTLGGHVDHVLTRRAVEGLDRDLWFYADYPYVGKESSSIQRLIGEDWTSKVFPVSSMGLDAWGRAVAAHASQISTFWSDSGAMRNALFEYYHQEMGVRLWRKSKKIKIELVSCV